MGGNQHLEPSAPEFLCQSDTNLMRHVWRDLPLSKGLVTMKCHNAILLAEPLLDRHHFASGCQRGTVDRRHVILLFCFLCIYCILDYICQSLCLRLRHPLFFIESGIFCLGRVLNIDHYLAQPSLYIPYLGYCHMHLLSKKLLRTCSQFTSSAAE